MPADVRSVAFDGASGADASVTIGSDTTDTDLLVAIGDSDFFDIGIGFGPPTDPYTGGPGWGDPVVTIDRGNEDSKIRIWVMPVPTGQGGAETFDLSPIAGEDVGLTIVVVQDADLADPVDDAAGATSAAGGVSPSLHIAPEISPATDDALLISAVGTKVFDGGSTYTPPPGMTELVDFVTGGGTSMTAAAAYEQLSAAGPTGTRTWEYDALNKAGLAVLLAIRSAGASEPPNDGAGALTPGPGALSGTGAVEVVGAGALTPGAGGLAGTGAVEVTGAGALTPGAGSLAGTGVVGDLSITGAGSLTPGPGALAGSGTVEVTGAGALTPGAGSLAGVGTVGQRVDLTVVIGPTRVGTVAIGATRAGTVVIGPTRTDRGE